MGMRTVAILLLILITGCTCPNKYFPQENPPPMPLCPEVNRPVRVALVLGSGGAKGFAHVGVLEEFEKANIPIDLIVGCSAGSLVGCLYADCPRYERLKSLLPLMNSNFLLDLNIWKARYGLCQGRSMRKFLCDNLQAKAFDELKIPFFTVATDLCNGELVAIGGGPIAPAVEASCAIPLVFAPVELHGRVFVDGGVIDPVPVRIASFFEPEIIVAVDLQNLLPRTFPVNLFGVAKRSAEINFMWQSESCIKGADVVIKPKLRDIGTFDDEYCNYIYYAGRAAARKAIPQIKELLECKGFTIPPVQLEEQNEHILELLDYIVLEASLAAE